MTVQGLWACLEEIGGEKQWEIRARAADKDDRKSLESSTKRKAGFEEERQKWREDWIRDNYKPEDNWIVHLETLDDVKEWLTSIRGTLNLDHFDKVGVDLGEISPRMEDLERRLTHLHNIGRLTREEMIERYVVGRLRLINSLVQRLRHTLGSDIRPCITFDHPDSRDKPKENTEIHRITIKVIKKTQEEYLKLEREKVRKLAREKNKKRWAKTEKESAARKGDTARDDLDGIVDEVAGVDVEMAEGRAGETDESKSSNSAKDVEPQATTLFPPLVPVNDDFLASLSGTAWGQLARKEAFTLRATTEQAFADTECDYLIPTYLAGDSLSDDERVLAYVPSSPLLQPPRADLSSSARTTRPARLSYSQDSDLPVSVDASLCDVLWSTYKSKGRTVHRLVVVEQMYEAMGWVDRFDAAAQAAFAGNDFTGVGIPNVGMKSLRNNTQDKFDNLRKLTRSGEALLAARVQFLSSSASPPSSTSSTSSTTPVNAGSFNFTSLEQMSDKFDSYVEPFYLTTASTTAPRLSLDQWLNSISIQGGWGGTGEVVSKTAIRKRLEREARNKMERARQACQGTKVTPSSPPSDTPPPRQHQIQSVPSASHALLFDKPPTLAEGGEKPYRTTGNFNGPSLISALEEENQKLLRHQATVEGNGGSGEPPKKKSKQGKVKSPNEATLDQAKTKDANVGAQHEKPSASAKGEGKKTKENEENEEDDEPTEDGASRSRFPKNLHGKMATMKRIKSQGVFQRLVGAGLDPKLPEAFDCFLSWIRQFGVLEMPEKVSLIQRVLRYYSIFSPTYLKKIINGGNEFTKWTEGLLSRRQGYEEWLDKTRNKPLPGDDDLATSDEIRPYLQPIMESLSPSRQSDLEELVGSLELKKKDLNYIEADQGTKTTDFFVYLAAFDHAKAGLDCPILVESSFDTRNLVNFGTSISNSSRSDALQLDWILSKLITHFPSFLCINSCATPFDSPNDEVRKSFAELGEDGQILLSLLPTTPILLRTIRQCLASTPIIEIPISDSLPTKLNLFRSQLIPLLFDLAVSPSALRGDRPIATEKTEGAVNAVSDFISAAVEWMVRGLRIWAQRVEKGLENVVTLEDWITAAGGTERASPGEERLKDRETGKKKRKEKPKKSQGLNGDEELSDKKNITLVELKVLTASLRELRHRPFVRNSFSPLRSSYRTLTRCSDDRDTLPT